MDEQELKEWFWNIYNNCYIFNLEEYKHIDYFCYDVNYIRTKKLLEILNIDFIYNIEPVGKCMFEINHKFNNMYINYEKIWFIIQTNLSLDDMQTTILIKSWLNENDKLKKININSWNYLEYDPCSIDDLK